MAGWESYVRSRIDAHNKIVVTGSNASMLSRELGTRMTGRHISHRLMPFSYSEFIGYKKFQAGEDSLNQYMQLGGFPAYLQTERKNCFRIWQWMCCIEIFLSAMA